MSPAFIHSRCQPFPLSLFPPFCFLSFFSFFNKDSLTVSHCENLACGVPFHDFLLLSFWSPVTPQIAKNQASTLRKKVLLIEFRGSPGSSGGKESVCNAGDRSSIPRSGRSPGEGNSNPLQYSCLENSIDRGA